MPNNIKSLSFVQLGKESTWGTAVAQDTYLMGIESMTIDDWFEVLGNKNLGDLAPNTGGAAVVGVGGTASMSQRATYDHIGLIFDSIFGTATPSGAGPYTRTWTAPRTSQPTRSFYTLHRTYDGSNGYSLQGAIAKGFTIKIDKKGRVMVDSDWVGKVMDADATDSVAVPTVYWMNAHETTISVDVYGGTPAALDCKVKSVEIAVDSGTFIDYGLSSTSGCDYQYGDFTGSFKIVASTSDATVKAMIDAMDGSSPALVKREWKIATTDSTYTNTIDVSGFLATSPTIFSDDDGVLTFELEFTGDYDASTNLTSWLDVSLVNAVAAY